MSSNKAKNGNGKGDEFILIIMAFAGAFLLAWFYWSNRDFFHPLYYQIKSIQLFPVFLFNPELKEYLQGDIIDSKTYNMEQMLEGTAFYGKYAFWIMLPPLLYAFYKISGISTFKSAVLSNKDKGAEALLRINANIHKIVKPVLERDIRKEPANIGPWRYADTPLIWAVRNNLLYDEELRPFRFSQLFYNVPDDMNDPAFANAALVDPRVDSPYIGKKNNINVKQAMELFIGHLGPKIFYNDFFETFLQMAEYEKASPWMLYLAGAYYQFGASSKTKKSLAYPAIDRLAGMCGGKGAITQNMLKITSADIETIWKGADKDNRFKEYVSNHASFAVPFFMHLILWAKDGGKITPSEVIWLRPVNRLLYYSINQIGGKSAYPEALGSWAHFNAERFMGVSLHYPYVISAFNDLYSALYGEGYLPYKDLSADASFLKNWENVDPVNESRQKNVKKIRKTLLAERDIESVKEQGIEIVTVSPGLSKEAAKAVQLPEPEEKKSAVNLSKKDGKNVEEKKLSQLEILSVQWDRRYNQISATYEHWKYFLPLPSSANTLINQYVAQNNEIIKQLSRQVQTQDNGHCALCKQAFSLEDAKKDVKSRQPNYEVVMDTKTGTFSVTGISLFCPFCAWKKNLCKLKQLKKSASDKLLMKFRSDADRQFNISPEDFDTGLEIIYEMHILRDEYTDWKPEKPFDEMFKALIIN